MVAGRRERRSLREREATSSIIVGLSFPFSAFLIAFRMRCACVFVEVLFRICNETGDCLFRRESTCVSRV